MGYLEEIRLQLDNDDFPGFMHLWEEYRANDEVDGKELYLILQAIKVSDSKKLFGSVAEESINLWDRIDDDELQHRVLRVIIDLQTTNTPQMAEVAYQYLCKKYGDQKFFKEKIRLVGLRDKEIFQGAISNFELLTHMEEGKHIFHTGGWGVGEIVELSLIREQLIMEFENILGRVDLSFDKAFNNFIPLPENHFLAQRFGDPDKLEKEAKQNPVEVMRCLLGDLGAKTAAEIKEELCELVIPEAEWVKWWQTARAKMKKDTLIETPTNAQRPFKLRQVEISHDQRFQNALEVDLDLDTFIQTAHLFTRNFPEVLKNENLKTFLREKILHYLAEPDRNTIQSLQLYIFLEDFYNDHLDNALGKLIIEASDIEELIAQLNIPAFKKRVLILVREFRDDWAKIFASLFFILPAHFLRDYILKELNKPETLTLLNESVTNLLQHPTLYPETFIWYFQKVMEGKDIPYGDKEGQCQFFESIFVLLYHLEGSPDFRDLTKKIHHIISNKRYAVIRQILAESSKEYASEILLLATKCQTFGSHDLQILHSLAKVVHPDIEDKRKLFTESQEDEQIWTTQEGFNKIQERIQHIATVETVENAKEIEAARALGDLRENSEFKFAQEKRARLQAEMKLLSDQIRNSRILTPVDVEKGVVDLGVVVELLDPKANKVIYTILGPWDADPDHNILSYQSPFAQAIKGQKVDNKFFFRDDEYKVLNIRSYFE